MKLEKEFPAFLADTKTVAAAYGLNLAVDDGSKTGLKTMHLVHTIISRNRAYDDSHPGFASGQWPRVLPFDGRDYCWLYDAAPGCNDTHVATLLKKVRDTIREEAAAASH